MKKSLKKKNIFYGKRTISIFIILTLGVLIYSFIKFIMMSGGGHMGFPFVFYSYGISGPNPATDSINHSYPIYLILDLIIYYISAVLLSFGISKLKKN